MLQEVRMSIFGEYSPGARPATTLWGGRL